MSVSLIREPIDYVNLIVLATLEKKMMKNTLFLSQGPPFYCVYVCQLCSSPFLPTPKPEVTDKVHGIKYGEQRHSTHYCCHTQTKLRQSLTHCCQPQPYPLIPNPNPFYIPCYTAF